MDRLAWAKGKEDEHTWILSISLFEKSIKIKNNTRLLKIKDHSFYNFERDWLKANDYVSKGWYISLDSLKHFDFAGEMMDHFNSKFPGIIQRKLENKEKKIVKVKKDFEEYKSSISFKHYV